MSTSSAKDTIMEEYVQEKEKYEHLSASVLQIMEGLMKKEGIRYASVGYRIKETESLSEKIGRKEDKYKCLSDITDIGGVRIITYYADDVDRVAKLVEREFEVDRENSIDKRKALEPNVFGYLSLHYVISLDKRRAALPEYGSLEGLKIEVQIRSILQHSWAEMEHDMGYKSKIEVPKEIVRDFSRLAGLLEIADKEFQEIRQKISQYESKISKKLQKDGQEEEVSLDAVSLQILLDTDNAFIELDQTIEDRTGIEINSNRADYQTILNRLHWLGITTIGETKRLLEEEKGLAVKLAVESLRDKKYKGLIRTVGLLYLCYARLVKNYPQERWIDFLTNNNPQIIGKWKEFAEKLSEIYSKVSEEKEQS